MLYWKYSPNRIFFLNEYWILVPTAIIGNYLIIRKICSHKNKTQQLKEELKQLKIKIERYKKEERLRRIVYLACGLSGLSYLSMCRGGADLIDVDYINKCGIENGFRFLDNDRLRKIIHDLYHYKRQGKIIFITSTAICHLANQYGKTFLAFPFAIGDFGVTNIYQTIRKTVVTLALGGIGPCYVIGTPRTLVFAVLLAMVGLRLGLTDLDKIPTSPVYETSVKNLKPRVSDLPDVVTVNFRNKIIMTNPAQEKRECWLPEQALLNPGCKVKATEIPSAINLGSHDLTYSEVVNMQDVTGLDRVEFSDKLDLGQVEPSSSKPSTGKVVNFLKKFGDRGTIDEVDTWETSENTIPENRDLRTRN